MDNVGAVIVCSKLWTAYVMPTIFGSTGGPPLQCFRCVKVSESVVAPSLYDDILLSDRLARLTWLKIASNTALRKNQIETTLCSHKTKLFEYHHLARVIQHSRLLKTSRSATVTSKSDSLYTSVLISEKWGAV